MLFRKPDRVLYVTNYYCHYIRLISAGMFALALTTLFIIVDVFMNTSKYKHTPK